MDKKVLQLKGFQQQLLQTDWEAVQLQSPAGFQRLAVGLYDTPTFVAYCYREHGAVIDRILDDANYTPADMLAVDFVAYSQDFLDNEKSYAPPKSRLLYIYGIGEETSNNNFSDKLLSGLIKGNNMSGNLTIIASDMIMGGLFTRNYPISAALVDQKLHIVR